MEHLDKRQKITIMIAIMAAMLFAALNQTIVGTALPKIISHLGGMEYYSWVFTIYMLTSSITAILVGRLSDIYGRKPFILIGIGIFIVGSFLNGTSANIYQLIIYRGIQGLGGGMIISTAFTSIGDLFSPRERGKWTGLMSASFGLASVFGPALGGYIVDHFDWHWVFWVFLPFGVIALILIWMMFPSVVRKEGEAVDYWGSLFLTLTISPLLLAFSWAGGKFAWDSLTIIALFGASIVSLLLFIAAERKAKSPVLPLQLFKNSIFTVSNMAGFIIGTGMFGTIMYMPFFVQGVIGTSATVSGFVTMPMTLSLVIGSAICGQIISRTGKYKFLAIAGLFVMTAGMFSMSYMSTSSSNETAVINMIITGLGLGFAFPVFTLTIQNAVDQKLLGVATASAQLFRQIGGTVGVAIMGTIMTHRMVHQISQLTLSSGMDLAKLQPDAAQKLAALQNPKVLMDPVKLAQIKASLPAQLSGLFDKLEAVLREALSFALTGVFFVGAATVFAAFLLTFFLKEIPLRTSNRVKEAAGEAERRQAASEG